MLRFFGLVRGTRAGTPHQGTQLAQLLVIHKQLARQSALVAEHVDQKTQRPQAVAQFLEGLAALIGPLHFVDQQPLHRVAHANHGHGCLVQAQHRQHTPHLRQLPGNHFQWTGVLRLAKELVHRPLGLAQRDAQFIHHTAHGLVIADTPVQLLHPGLQWLGLSPRTHTVEALGQAIGPVGHVFVSSVQFFKSSLQVEHRRRHFHGQRRRWRLSRANRGIQRPGHGLRQTLAVAMELAQRVTYQAELIRRRFEFVAITPSQRRPSFCGRGNALACLRQHHGIKATKTALLIIHGRKAIQGKSAPHRLQCRGLPGIGVTRLGTEKKQVLHQPIAHGRVALGQRGVLHEHTRGHSFHVHIRDKQPLRKCLKKTSANLPERSWLFLRLRGSQSQRKIAQITGSVRATLFDDLQHGLIKPGTGLNAIRHRGSVYRRCRLTKTPLRRPQVGRMNAVYTGQGLHIAVLRKQRYSRHRFAGEHAVQVFTERKTGTLQYCGGFVCAQLRALHIPLDSRLHRPQDQGGRSHAHHLQRTTGLVQLLARHAQGTGIQRRQIRLLGYLGIVDKAAQRLDGSVQRLAQFIQHPGQRPQILLAVACVCRQCVVDINR